MTLHDRVIVGARSAVHADVAEGQRVLGIPAMPERESKRIILSMAQLPRLCKDVRMLKEKLGLLESNNEVREPKDAA